MLDASCWGKFTPSSHIVFSETKLSYNACNFCHVQDDLKPANTQAKTSAKTEIYSTRVHKVPKTGAKLWTYATMETSIH